MRMSGHKAVDVFRNHGITDEAEPARAALLDAKTKMIENQR